jgi:hypothetical protein
MAKTAGLTSGNARRLSKENIALSREGSEFLHCVSSGPFIPFHQHNDVVLHFFEECYIAALPIYIYIMYMYTFNVFVLADHPC